MVQKKELLRAVVWRRLDRVGLENCRLWKIPVSEMLKGSKPKETNHGFQLEGTVFITEEGKPYEVHYEVVCNARWETLGARITVGGGTSVESMELRCNDNHRWTCDGKRLEAFDGIVDVDLGFTPATNTLPIRRLALKVGGHADVATLWVKFPGLSLETLRQRYTRLHSQQFRYESSTGFVGNLDVDDLGLVIRYGEVWERVSE